MCFLLHVVGAGKTYEMVAAAMESKRLGLSQKNSFSRAKPFDGSSGVQNSTVISGSQYPGSNQEDSNSAKTWKKFCARIAMGNYAHTHILV